MCDAAYVREQYSSERNLTARASLYADTTGPFAGDVAFDAIAEAAPRRVLEVGCGTGWFAARLQRELGAEVVAIDQSERMVELARADGVDARVGDVQQLPFDDETFDCVAAIWMLYHVTELDTGLREIARVLRPGGRLVAVTNGADHLIELWKLAGTDAVRAARDVAFGAENGGETLRRQFANVEVRDSSGTVRIEDRDAVVRYLGSTAWKEFADRVPDPMEAFVAKRSNVVFVATT
jgi:SAM-dependent methyltransferase